MPEIILDEFKKKLEKEAECGEIVFENNKLVFKTIYYGLPCPAVYSPFVWHTRPNSENISEWPTADNIFDVLSGKSYGLPIIKASLIFTPSGIWEITVNIHASLNTLEPLYLRFFEHTLQYEAMSLNTTVVDNFAKLWEDTFRLYGLRIFFTRWNNSYKIRSRIPVSHLGKVIHRPLSLRELAIQRLTPKNREVYWSVEQKKWEAYLKNISEVKHKVEPIPPLLKLLPRPHKKTCIKLPSKKLPINKKKPPKIKPKLLQLREKEEKTYITKDDIIKTTEGLEWELFGIFGKVKMTKREYLKNFDNNPPLQNFLDDALDYTFVTKDIIMGSIYQENRIWDLIGLESLRYEVKKILLERIKVHGSGNILNIIPRTLLIEYSNLFDFDENKKVTLKDKKIYSMFNSFWTFQDIEKFATDFLRYEINHIIAERMKRTNAKSLLQLGCSQLTGINNYLDVELNEEKIKGVLSLDTCVLLNLYYCLIDRIPIDEPKSLLIERIVNANAFQDAGLRNVICNNLRRYLSFNEYEELKFLLPNCLSKYDEIASKVPSIIQKMTNDYYKLRLHSKTLTFLISLANKHGIPYTDIINTPKIDTGVLKSNLIFQTQLRDNIMKQFKSLDELYQKFPQVKDIFPEKLRTSSFENSISLLSLNELLKISKITEAVLPPLKHVPSIQIDARSYLGYIRIEEKNLLSKYFNKISERKILIPSITLVQTITEEDLVAKIFERSYEKEIKKELDKFVSNTTLDISYEQVQDYVISVVQKSILPLDVEMLLNEMKSEKIIQQQKEKTVTVLDDIENLIYFNTKDSEDVIRDYIYLASKIDYLMSFPFFRWVQCQDDDVKKNIIENVILQNSIQLTFIPELISKATRPQQIKAVIERDIDKHYIYLKDSLVYGVVSKVKVKPKYEISRFCTEIKSEVPLNACIFKFISNHVYILDKRLLTTNLVILSTGSILYQSSILLINFSVVNDDIYLLRIDGIVLRKTSSITQYKLNVVNFYKSEQVEAVLYNNGDLYVNDKLVSSDVCTVCFSKCDTIFIKQNGNTQYAYLLVYDPLTISHIPNIEHYYSDGLNSYFQRSIETITNKRRIYHKPDQREYVLGREIAILSNGVLQLRESRNKYEKCYDVYNGYIMCLNTKYSEDKFSDFSVIHTVAKIRYPQKHKDHVLALN
jgi:hypothetical protein